MDKNESVWQYQILMKTWRKTSSSTLLISRSVNWYKLVVQPTIIPNNQFYFSTKLNPDS